MPRLVIALILLASGCTDAPTGANSPSPDAPQAEEPAPPPSAEAPAADGTAMAEASCTDDCRIGVKQDYQSCIDNGGDPGECRMEIGQTVRACMAACPEAQGAGDEAVPCGKHCRLEARERYNACVDEGGDADQCRTTAGEEARACAAGCSE